MSAQNDGENGMIPEPTLERRVEIIETQIKGMTQLVESLIHMIEAHGETTQAALNDLVERLERVENKTQSFSDRDPIFNCPKCHRRIIAASGTCPFCAYNFSKRTV